jgi:integrase
MIAKTDNHSPRQANQLQEACMLKDDEMRWLLALISDTGMRLAEAAGLHKDDIILDAPYPI